MSHVVEIMLSRFATLYGEPKTPNVDAYMAEYVAALKGTSPAVLREATDHLVRTNRHRSWPTIGDCTAACTDAADKLSPRDASKRNFVPRSIIEPPSEAELERNRLAREWRERMVAEYGSVDRALEAHQRQRNSVPMASRKSTFKHLSPGDRK